MSHSVRFSNQSSRESVMNIISLMDNIDNEVQTRLLDILSELKNQPLLAIHYPEHHLSFQEEMDQIQEYITNAGEYGIAYECVVSNLERVPFMLSGRAAIKLLEVALLMGRKTDRPEDAMFETEQRGRADQRCQES